MYIRLRKNKSGTTTVYLLDSMRVEGLKHARTKVIKCYGSSSDELTLDKWVKEANLLKEELLSNKINSKKIMSLRQGKDIDKCKVLEFGVRYFYGQLFDKFFASLKLENKDKRILKDLVMMRISKPVSKLKTCKVSASFGIDLDINKIYRFMDRLDDISIDKIKKLVFNTTKEALGNKISVMFYDLTTVYFENNSQSDLKEFGYSKDGKSQHVQISLALIVSECGLPIGYEIFKGNRFEGSTLIPTLNKLRKQYKIEDVTIVADSAMLSNDNITSLIENGYKFIVAARMRNLGLKLTKEVLSEAGYITSGEVRYKSISVTQRVEQNGVMGGVDIKKRLVSVYSDKRYRKDQFDREKALKKINKYIGKKSKTALSSSFKKPYVKVNDDSIIEIDQNKINSSSNLDGYFGFFTNTELDPSKIIEQYKGLWQVERSFRITKHNLKIRPVYHYKDARIKAHFAICYLTFALLRNVEFLMRKTNLYIPIEELNLLLDEIKEVCIETKEASARILTDIPSELINIFTQLKLKPPLRFIAKNCSV